MTRLASQSPPAWVAPLSLTCRPAPLLGAWTRRISLLVLAGTALVAAPVEAGADQAPQRECFLDADCGAEEVCGGFYCEDASLVCTSSEDCEARSICDFRTSMCPDDCGTSCDDRCSVPNGQCQSTVPVCTSDFACGEDEICVMEGIPVCADGDATCEDAFFTRCDYYHRFCDPSESVHENCYPGEACDQKGRCVAEDQLELSNQIEEDPEREDRVKFPPDDDVGGCALSPTPQPPSSSLWLLAGAGALALCWRRRRCA